MERVSKAQGQRLPPWLMFVGLMLLAANLRGPFTNVGPIQDLIQESYRLSATAIGLLTTLPLAAFAILSPFAASLSRRFGIELCLVVAMSTVAFGAVLRSFSPVWGLYIGTICVGLGIAIGNVLLPTVIKRDFSNHIPTITGLSTVTMGLTAAMLSMAMVPLATMWGWRMALSTNILLAFFAALIWFMRLGTDNSPIVTRASSSNFGVWRTPLAWYITLFMGANSYLYYVLISWLPSILTSSGYSPGQAGTLHGVMQLATALPGLFLGPVVHRLKDHRLLAGGMAGLMTFATLGLLAIPQYAVVWVSLFGIDRAASLLLFLCVYGAAVS